MLVTVVGITESRKTDQISLYYFLCQTKSDEVFFGFLLLPSFLGLRNISQTFFSLNNLFIPSQFPGLGLHSITIEIY